VAKPKTKAPVRKAAPAQKQSVIAASSKPTGRAPAPKPPVNTPAPELEMKAPPQEPVAIVPAPEILKES
jgi:hypothetical protein